MGLTATVVEASGRATCRICSNIIAKGLLQINVIGYRNQASLHNDPDDCERGLRTR